MRVGAARCRGARVGRPGVRDRARDPDVRPPAAGALRGCRGGSAHRGGGRDPRRRGLAPAIAYGFGLAARYRQVRGGRSTRSYERNHPMIRLLSPWWLLAVLPWLALAGVSVWRQLHREAFAVRFSNVELLRAIAPGGIGNVRRYAPAVALLVSLLILALSLARPSIDTKEPLERATVMLALDVSLSIQSQDVRPTRIAP